MKARKTYLVVLAAILMALTVVVTWVGHIPVPLPIQGAYIHPGDSVIYLSGYLLGPVWGAAVGGIGSCLADLLSGAAIYAPATLVIKAVMGLIAGLMFRMRRPYALGGILAMLGASLWMCLGYFLYEWMLYGVGNAWASLPFNLIQAAGGVIIGELLLLVTRKLPFTKKLHPES